MPIGRLLIVLTLLAAGLCPSPASGQNLLCIPFENVGREPRLEWIGEGLAELNMMRLAGENRAVFSREEWLATLEKLGLPPSGRFSHATMLKIGEEVDADYIVFGSFTSDGKGLTVTARVLRMDPLGLSPSFVESGAIQDLIEIHGRLAWHVLTFIDAARRGGPISRQAFLETLERPRLDAFEQYIRGQMASNEDLRGVHLREAARLASDWNPPALALGLDAFARGNCSSALTWFSRVALGGQGGTEAAFYSGVCHLRRNDAARAEKSFSVAAQQARLARQRSGGLAEALNNLGVARARQDKWDEAAKTWQQAQQIDPGEPDYWFNLGLAALRANDPGTAVGRFREALRRKPDHAEAQASLVVALERSAAAEAEHETGAVSTLASLPAPRVKSKLNILLFAPGTDRTPPGHRAAHLQLHLTRGRESLGAGKLSEAQREFSEAVLIAPESAEAHVGLGKVYERMGRIEDAIRELRAALWTRDDPAVRVHLAKLYLAQKQTAEARTELRAALKSEPGNAEARRLLTTLEAGAREGGHR